MEVGHDKDDIMSDYLVLILGDKFGELFHGISLNLVRLLSK